MTIQLILMVFLYLNRFLILSKKVIELLLELFNLWGIILKNAKITVLLLGFIV